MIFKVLSILFGVIIILFGVLISRRKFIIKERITRSSIFFYILFIELILRNFREKDGFTLITTICIAAILVIFVFYAKVYTVYGLCKEELIELLADFFSQKSIPWEFEDDTLMIAYGEKRVDIKLKEIFKRTTLYLSQLENSSLCNQTIDKIKNYIKENKKNKFSYETIIYIILGILLIFLGVKL
ncbi:MULTISPECIES: hypothetical protein [unclassified Clostridium]|uniref:hypothetical protein n=1 Tax=unclassified Clostridium TaxID=2614128 RepID=UPI0025BDFC6E|nr:MULTISPECIES: hypothetical protein [unclassified Clostridium]